MTADYMISPDAQTVFSTGWDDLKFADILDHRNRLSKDTAFRPDYRQIIDLTRVTRTDLSSDEIAVLAEQPLFNPGSRRAIVAGSKLFFGLGRVFHAHSDVQTIGVFYGLDEAVQWVGLPIEVAIKSFAELRAKQD